MMIHIQSKRTGLSGLYEKSPYNHNDHFVFIQTNGANVVWFNAKRNLWTLSRQIDSCAAIAVANDLHKDWLHFDRSQFRYVKADIHIDMPEHPKKRRKAMGHLVPNSNRMGAEPKRSSTFDHPLPKRYRIWSYLQSIFDRIS